MGDASQLSDVHTQQHIATTLKMLFLIDSCTAASQEISYLYNIEMKRLTYIQVILIIEKRPR